jgi:hypothetical protein
LLAFSLLDAILPPPVNAGTMYLSGGQDLSAALSGSNEFPAGTIVPITVVVENSGLVDMKMIRNDLLPRDEQPNTAKLVKVGLCAGEAPVTIKSDAQMIGDLTGGTSKTVTFDMKISPDARTGSYSLPLTVEYTYLYDAESEGQDNLRTDHLNVRTEGYLSITLKNIGNEDVSQGVLRITRNGNSPVIPTDSSIYLESLPQEAEMTTRFKVSISSMADGDQVYPLDLSLRYQGPDGDTASTETISFGVPVGGKVSLSIVPRTTEILPEQKSVISVEYKNTGAATVYSAQARISAVDPFTSSDDTAFLGDIAPGETRIARFEITTNVAATVKEYGLDSEIRYRDALDNSLISDIMKVPVMVIQPPGILNGLLNPLSLSLIAVGCIGSVWVLRGLQRKR